MASYFDHFLLVSWLNSYCTDALFVGIFVMIVYSMMLFQPLIMPYRMTMMWNAVVNHWLEVLNENMGKKDVSFYPYMMALFFFLLGLNLMGFFLFTLPPTTHITMTFGMALSVWLGVMGYGFWLHRSAFLSNLMPSGAPLGLSPLLVFIEIASQLSRPLALGMRLAANLTAGHILLAILADFSCQLLYYQGGLAVLFPLLMLMAMTLLEIAVLIIQAYVFTLLMTIYLRDSLMLH